MNHTEPGGVTMTRRIVAALVIVAFASLSMPKASVAGEPAKVTRPAAVKTLSAAIAQAAVAQVNAQAQQPAQQAGSSGGGLSSGAKLGLGLGILAASIATGIA